MVNKVQSKATANFRFGTDFFGFFGLQVLYPLVTMVTSLRLSLGYHGNVANYSTLPFVLTETKLGGCYGATGPV